MHPSRAALSVEFNVKICLFRDYVDAEDSNESQWHPVVVQSAMA